MPAHERKDDLAHFRGDNAFVRLLALLIAKLPSILVSAGLLATSAVVYFKLH